MKRRVLAAICIGAVLAVSGCSGVADTAENTTAETENIEEEVNTVPEAEEGGSASNGNVLVAYFSWADNAVLADDVDAVSSPSVIPPGNVQQLAGWVQEETGGDLFSIRVTDPYPSDWDECLDRANQERGENARPELEERVENLDDYDTVFLGYPNWWYGVPMPLLTFLEENDLSGKQVYLFCSHGTGGLANSVEIITEAAPDAVILDNIFDCYEEDAASSREDIQNWVAETGYSAQDNGGDNMAENRNDTVESTEETGSRQISVQFGENTVIYELNDSPAADSLYEQLPITTEVEDFSTNEKIFYPSQELDTSDSPVAEGGAGTLAYYAPWGDVVMFYDDYSANSSLFELGHAVSGGEQIGEMSGTIVIDIADTED